MEALVKPHLGHLVDLYEQGQAAFNISKQSLFLNLRNMKQQKCGEWYTVSDCGLRNFELSWNLSVSMSSFLFWVASFPPFTGWAVFRMLCLPFMFKFLLHLQDTVGVHDFAFSV